MIPEKPDIFSFTNYRTYLKAYCDYYVASSRKSIRSLGRKCGIASPNYFQQVITERRSLTQLTATKFAKGAELNALERDYLLGMLKLDRADAAAAQQDALTAMRNIIRRAQRRTVSDGSIHSSWVNPVLWELSKTKLFQRQAGKLRATLRNSATEAEIADGLQFLIKKGFIKGAAGDDRLVPASIDFEPSNDMRRIDLQRSHLRFLQLAQHRLNDPLEEREFQGLTMAARADDFEAIRARCREFIARLNADYSVDADGDEVIRVQLCAFKVTLPEK